MIHVRILIVVISCASFVTSFDSRPAPKDLQCAKDKSDKPCRTACSFDDNIKKFCCQLTRCTTCWKDINFEECGPEIEKRVQVWIDTLTAAWQNNKCQVSEKYPSVRCLYIFYEIWFYLLPVLIVVLLVAIIVLVIIRKRRKRLAKRKK